MLKILLRKLLREEEGEKMDNLWEQVGNECLRQALKLLKENTAPTAGTAETVKTLVDTAISIDMLNLHWAAQNRRYSAAVFRGQHQ